jgi:predicted dehydrogenase
MGAHGDKLPLGPLPVPAQYDPLPKAGLPSAVMELAENYAAFARDLASGTKTAPTFRDAVRMHKLIDAAMESSETGCRATFPGQRVVNNLRLKRVM